MYYYNEELKKGNYVVYWQHEEGDVVANKQFNELNQALRFASKMVCFNDCFPLKGIYVEGNNKTYLYTGWQPGMVCEWITAEGDTWKESFPEYDH